MPTIQLQNFLDASNRFEGPLKVNTKKGTITGANAGTCGNMAVRLITSQRKLDTQNQRSIEAFKESLTEQYGSDIADKSLESALSGGNTLTGVMVKNTVGHADELLAGKLDNLWSKSDLYLKNCIAQYESGSMKLAEHFGETGRDILGLRITAALNDQLDLTNQAIETIVSDTVAEFYASGEANLCKKLVEINNNTELCNTLQATLENIVHNDQERSKLYKPFLELALANIIENAVNNDSRPGCPILQSLGKQLADTLDEHICYSLNYKHAHQDYAKVMAEITHNSTSQLSFLEKNKGTFHNMQTDVKFLAKNINQLFDRVNATKIGDDFPDIETPENLTNITITNSDPHHGGQRVMILEFNGQQDQRIVYKPRDCRIDAKLVGDATSGNEKSVASLINELSEKNAIETYHFLLKEDEGGHFGFVQFLETNHNLTSQQQVNNFYKEAGQLAAIAYLTGTTDLHQGNLIVSNGHPFLTDLEISGSKSVLSEPSLDSTGFDSALKKKTEVNLVPPFAVEKDGKIGYQSPQKSSDTDNFVTLNGQKVDIAGEQEYKNSFEHGFKDVITLFHDSQNNKQLVALLQDCRGMHVRYHPVSTPDQYNRLQTIKLLSDKLPNEHEFKSDKSAVDKRFPAEHFDGIFKESMTESHTQLDVAYYTRELGQAGVFYHSAEGPRLLKDEDQHFDYDSLEEMITRVESIAGEPGYDAACSAVDSFLESLQPEPTYTINL